MATTSQPSPEWTDDYELGRTSQSWPGYSVYPRGHREGPDRVFVGMIEQRPDRGGVWEAWRMGEMVGRFASRHEAASTLMRLFLERAP